MKIWIEELVWLVCLIIIAYLLFNPELALSFNDIDINIHDTYFIFSGFQILVLITILIIFIVYLFRMLIYNFKNVTVNIIFSIADILQLIIVVAIANMLGSFIKTFPQPEEYIYHSTQVYHKLYYALIVTAVILALFEVFTVYKTVRVYSNKAQ